MVVQHNISGMNANRQLNITTGIQAKSSEKLSSGYKVNRAADDAAGLAISEKMRRQIRGLSQDINNAQDGVSWCQIADGALDEVDNMLERVKELSVQAANETLTDADRSYIDEEVQKISAEIDRIHANVTFNEIPIFDGGMNPSNLYVGEEGSIVLEVGNGKKIEILMPFVGSDGTKVDSVAETEAVGTATSYGNTEIARFAQEAAAYAINKLATNFPNLFAAASSSGIKIGLELGNIDGSSGTLAYALLSMAGNSTSTTMGYTMKIDTSDYAINDFPNMSADKKSDLAAVIAHEMTHLVMYDTLTAGMANNNGFPKWFKEGAAQTSSGDNNWVSNRVNASSSDSAVKNFMSQLSSMPYGTGYVATMYLGQLASGQSNVNATNIRNGLDNFMTYIAQGHTFNEAIAHFTPYSSQSAFESGFSGADTASFNFVRDLLTARGSGAGSIMGELSDAENSIFSLSNVSGATSTNYNILTDNTRYGNAYGSGYDFSRVAGGGGGGTDTAATLYLQVGTDNKAADVIALNRYSISVDQITNYAGFNVTTAQNARNNLTICESAASSVSAIRSYYGALQNRLEHTVKNLGNVVENTQSSESIIRDTDMAEEMVKYSNNNILMQAGQAVLAQANQSNQGVMALLQ